MDSDPGPHEGSDSDGGGVHIDHLCFGTTLPTSISTVANIVIRQLNLSLVPDFTFMTSQDRTRSLCEDGSRLEIGGNSRNPGRAEVESRYKGDSGLENNGGTAMLATNSTSGGGVEVVKGDKGYSGPGNRGTSASRETVGAKIMAVSGKTIALDVDQDGQGDRGLEIHGGTTTMAREGAVTMAAMWKTTTLEVDKGDKGVSGLENRGTTAMRATEGAKTTALEADKGDKGPESYGGTARMAKESAMTIAATWRTTPTIRPTIRTTTKTSIARINDSNLSTPKYRNKSWSSEDSDGGVAIMIADSLKPLNYQASSLVSPPIRFGTVTASEIQRDQSISPTNTGAIQDLLGTVSTTNDSGIQNSLGVVSPISDRAIEDLPGAVSPTNDRRSERTMRKMLDYEPYKAARQEHMLQYSPSVVLHTNDRAIQNSPDSVPTPLHFYRKSHHAQHKHHQSVTPGPFTCTKTRKYKLLHIPDKTTHTQKVEPDINDLTDGLQTLALRPARHAISWVYSPAEARKALRQWQYDEDWMRNAERLEAKNRFRGHDMNEGTNRETATLFNSINDTAWAAPHFEGGPEMRMKITEMLNRFSLWAQLEPIELDAEELKGMFDVVFIGSGLGNSGWARKPGSWWATRKTLFDGHRGRTFLEEIDLWVEEIEDGREKWKRENKGKLFAIGSLKRKANSVKFQVDIEGDRRKKRIKLPKTKSEQVMSEAWRARRRMQEKKAGRWTDGTLRMDRMWAEFHWVLPEDDPRDFRNWWPRDIFTRSYY